MAVDDLTGRYAVADPLSATTPDKVENRTMSRRWPSDLNVESTTPRAHP
jgi:hypothetical protein